MPGEDMIYRTTLKKVYGLTDHMIERLGPPDKRVPNPYYRSRTSTLYRRERVEKFIEANQDDYREVLEKRARRSASAKSSATKRREELMKWANAVDIEIEQLPCASRLRKLAAEHFEAQALEQKMYDQPGEVNTRGVVAFIRHNRTNYEKLLTELEGVPGATEAYLCIKDRVNTLVCETLGVDPWELVKEKEE